MSIHCMSWVFRHSDERLGRRLVLLVLADHAHDDGTEAWPSVATIAAQARLSKRQVQRALADMEAAGAIEQTGKSRTGTSVYSVKMSGVTNTTVGGDKLSPGGVTSTAQTVSEMSPEPSLGTIRSEPSLTHPPVRRVDRRIVTAEEASLASQVLSYWNVTTQQSLTAWDWLAKVIMRHREHPALTVADHQALIYATLHGEHWWSGPPTPSIIYGNAAQFERSMMAARNPNTGRGAYDVALAALQEA